MPVSCSLGLHCLATELALVDKSVGVVNAFHVVPHISPGGSSLLADGAEEKSWWLVLAINKLVQLVGVDKVSACRGQYQASTSDSNSFPTVAYTLNSNAQRSRYS